MEIVQTPLPDYDTYQVAVLDVDGTRYRMVAAAEVRCPQCGATRRGIPPAEQDAWLRFEVDATGRWALRCMCGLLFYPDTAETVVSDATIDWIARRFSHDPILTVAGDGHNDGGAPAPPNIVIYAGHAFRHSLNGNPAWSYTPPEGWLHAAGWNDGGYRAVWFSNVERGILTYCEGDLDLRLYPDRTTFVRAMNAAAEFYGSPPLRKDRS